jgi:hypothetical protein
MHPASCRVQVVVWAADDKGRWRPLASADPPTVGAWVTHVVWDTPPSVGGGSGARADSVLYGVTSEDAPDRTTIRWLEEGGSTGIVFVSGGCGSSRALACLATICSAGGHITTQQLLSPPPWGLSCQ